MKITKQNNSVLIELSQAELSAIKLMAEQAIQAGVAVLDIEVKDSVANEGKGPKFRTPSAYSTLMYCSRFLGVIGDYADNDEVDISTFASMFIPMGTAGNELDVGDVPII